MPDWCFARPIAQLAQGLRLRKPLCKSVACIVSKCFQSEINVYAIEFLAAQRCWTLWLPNVSDIFNTPLNAFNFPRSAQVSLKRNLVPLCSHLEVSKRKKTRHIKQLSNYRPNGAVSRRSWFSPPRAKASRSKLRRGATHRHPPVETLVTARQGCERKLEVASSPFPCLTSRRSTNKCFTKECQLSQRDAPITINPT